MKRVILVGKAGSGKDFFRDYLKGKEPLDVSYTTRPKREGEIEGYTYNYINEKLFKSMESEEKFYEAVSFNGWYYGTSIENWNNSVVFIMTPSGIKHISDKDWEDCIIVYFDISENIRRERLSKRSDADSVERRILADNEDFKSFLEYDVRISDSMYNCDELYELIKNY